MWSWGGVYLPSVLSLVLFYSAMTPLVECLGLLLLACFLFASVLGRLGSAPSKAAFLHIVWIDGPLFILWHIWLERNRRIFQDVRIDVMHLWWKISHSLHETIQAKCELNGAMDQADLAMCNCLNFYLQDGAATQ